MTEAWHAFPSPGLIIQGDGSAMQWFNCAPATWAGLLVAEKQGKRPTTGSPWYPSGASLRKASGDTSGGILPTTLDATANRVYGEDLIPRIATLATVDELLGQGYALGLLHQYRPISDAGLSCSPGFYGTHSGGLYGIRSTSSGVEEYLWADPLADGRRAGIFVGMRWVPRATIVKAGYALVLDASGETMRQRYPGYLYIVQTRTPYRPGAPTPPPLATIVTSAPATAEDRRNPMIRGAYGVTSSKVIHLAAGQPLYASPAGLRVTKMSTSAVVSFLGKVGSGWGAVIVGTGSPYADHVTRPTGLYVPLAAGTVTNR